MEQRLERLGDEVAKVIIATKCEQRENEEIAVFDLVRSVPPAPQTDAHMMDIFFLGRFKMMGFPDFVSVVPSDDQAGMGLPRTVKTVIVVFLTT